MSKGSVRRPEDAEKVRAELERIFGEKPPSAAPSPCPKKVGTNRWVACLTRQCDS